MKSCRASRNALERVQSAIPPRAGGVGRTLPVPHSSEGLRPTTLPRQGHAVANNVDYTTRSSRRHIPGRIERLVRCRMAASQAEGPKVEVRKLQAEPGVMHAAVEHQLRHPNRQRLPAQIGKPNIATPPPLPQKAVRFRSAAVIWPCVPFRTCDRGGRRNLPRSTPCTSSASGLAIACQRSEALPAGDRGPLRASDRSDFVQPSAARFGKRDGKCRQQRTGLSGRYRT